MRRIRRRVFRNPREFPPIFCRVIGPDPDLSGTILCLPQIPSNHAMSIRADCACGRRILADEKYAGKTVKCPACGRTLDVPELKGPLAPEGSDDAGGENPDPAAGPGGVNIRGTVKLPKPKDP